MGNCSGFAESNLAMEDKRKKVDDRPMELPMPEGI